MLMQEQIIENNANKHDDFGEAYKDEIEEL